MHLAIFHSLTFDLNRHYIITVFTTMYLHYKKKTPQRYEYIKYFLHFPPRGLKILHQMLYCHRVEQPVMKKIDSIKHKV